MFTSRLPDVLILLVIPDQDRLNRLKEAIQSAGFRTISTAALDQAWTRTDFFDFGGVVIDYELKDDITVAAFRQRFITLTLDEHATPEAVAMELASMFGRCSELVH